MIVDTHECMNPAEGYITIDLVYRKAYQFEFIKKKTSYRMRDFHQ